MEKSEEKNNLLADFISNKQVQEAYHMFLSSIVDDLNKIHDIKKIAIMTKILQDDRMLNSKYKFQITDRLFAIEDSKILDLLGEISLKIEVFLVELSCFIKVFNRIFIIESKVVLESILKLVSFINKNNQCSCLENIDFNDPKFSVVVNKIDEILNLFKERNGVLNYQEILDVIFNKILLLPNFDLMISSLEELEVQVKNNLENDLKERNTKLAAEEVGNNINKKSGRQYLNNIKI